MQIVGPPLLCEQVIESAATGNIASPHVLSCLWCSNLRLPLAVSGT